MLKEAIYNYLKENGPSKIPEIENGVKCYLINESSITKELKELVDERIIKIFPLDKNESYGFYDSQIRFMVNKRNSRKI